jgi:FkbM family methyltransferase
MAISCVVIDAGARYGLHPTWSDLRGVVDFHLFELDKDEAARLALKYRNDKRVKVYPVALFSHDTILRFTVNTHHALNSIYETNNELLSSNEYMLREFTPTRTSEAPARSVDSLFQNTDVHFLKLDVEGAEFHVLSGAEKSLRSTVLGVRSEVLFAPVFKSAPQFGEIHRLLSDAGFELLNFEYTGAGNKAGRFTQPGRYGKLISSDAVWIVGIDRLFSAKGIRLAEDIIRYSIFLINNNATDLAVDCMMRGRREGISFKCFASDPLFRKLHRKILLLFKSLLTTPQLEEKTIRDAYLLLFDAELPIMNKFYESELCEGD